MIPALHRLIWLWQAGWHRARIHAADALVWLALRPWLLAALLVALMLWWAL